MYTQKGMINKNVILNFETIPGIPGATGSPSTARLPVGVIWSSSVKLGLSAQHDQMEITLMKHSMGFSSNYISLGGLLHILLDTIFMRVKNYSFIIFL